MKLLRTFPKVSFEFGLASWQWLGIREQTPRFATCFGDIFLESLDGWWFLDTVEGTLELRWTSAVTMYAELESAEGRATYLMDDLVRDARSRGIHLGEEDVYAFNPHPALGGELGVNGLSAMRFELAVNWVGQMHDQVLHSSGEINLPPMPDDGRRAPAHQQVAAAWDAAWSQDETFDVPFEQYLATTTFAAVAAPGLHAQRYDTPSYATPAEPGLPAPTWPGGDPSEPLWSGQTEAARPWQAQSDWPQPATPPERYDASYDAAYPTLSAQHPTGVPDHQPGAPYAQGDRLTDSTPADGATPAHGADQDEHNQSAPAWGNPNWGKSTWSGPSWGSSPSWGGQAPAVAAGGGPPQAPRTEDPFTAWDDLWGKH